MIHTSRQALQQLDHVIRLFSASSYKVLQTYHVSLGYEWASNMTGCRPAEHMPPDHQSTKSLGNWPHIVHMPRLTEFPQALHSLWIRFLSNILHQNWSLSTEPPHDYPSSWAEVLWYIGWLRWHKNQKQNWYFSAVALFLREQKRLTRHNNCKIYFENTKLYFYDSTSVSQAIKKSKGE